ncbi:OsmC family peroxiredoxin [Candidatus Marinamargulisbacteria bacterium SCGC AG-343-D04]|nr:OsmC family peroxiredoxin [Candidatus Marinamargulisbacteria bacterium SCGC AG-343-D04]
MGKQQANATWTGSLKEGAGQFNLPKGNHTGQFTFETRFEDGNGTNPEELVGAALSSCFSMFLSAILGKDDFTVNSISSNATVTLDKDDNGPLITSIHLDVKGDVDSISNDDFQSYVEKAKNGCPISRLYQGTSITVSANNVVSA